MCEVGENEWEQKKVQKSNIGALPCGIITNGILITQITRLLYYCCCAERGKENEVGIDGIANCDRTVRQKTDIINFVIARGMYQLLLLDRCGRTIIMWHKFTIH